MINLYCKLQHNYNAKYTNLRFLYRKCQYRMSDGYKFTHYKIKIKIICRVRILWIIRTRVRINQRIRTHSFWVRILLGTNSPGYEISWYHQHSFFPGAIRIWNSLPQTTVGLQLPWHLQRGAAEDIALEGQAVFNCIYLLLTVNIGFTRTTHCDSTIIHQRWAVLIRKKKKKKCKARWGG